MTYLIKLVILTIVSLVFSCSKKAEVKPQFQSFEIVVPSNLSATFPQPASNIATKEGIALGRLLFYDPTLSGSNKFSCASCHLQQNSFSDIAINFSLGESQKPLLRNSMPLFNLAWATGYFWDGGAKNLESQVFAPLQSHDEMNQDLKELVTELMANPIYPPKFEAAFGTKTINSAFIARAIAQYERTFISANSKYDFWVRKEKNITLNSLELKGLDIFNSKCAACHVPDFFTDFDYHNNGLDSSFEDDSHENVYKGRYRITNQFSDIGKYKTPSLRNVALTAPYMHDGRFNTLEDVLNHYSENLKISNNIDINLQKKMSFTSNEKLELRAFLHTLTDYEFITNPNFGKP